MKVLRFSVLCLLSACAVETTAVTISPLDFGVVSEAGDYTGELRVTNVGATTATLQRIEQRGGTGGIFVITPDVTLEPGESTVWRVRLQVRELGLKQVDLAAVFTGSTTLFTVRARRGEPCEPITFDVGDARVGTSVTKTLQVQNPFAFPAELDLGAPATPFTITPSGKVRLAGGETRTVEVSFAPKVEGVSAAPWRFASRTDCLASSSTVRGRGLTRALVFSPGRLSGFGVLAPPSLKDLPVELRNESQAPIRVVASRSTQPWLALLSPLPIEVPAGQSVPLVVRLMATPTLGEHFAELVLSTDSELAPTVSLPVVAHRTEACVSASRTSLAFPSTENLCRSRGETVELFNACPHDVTLTNLRVPEGFALVMGREGATLAPGARMPVQLLFAPRTTGVTSDRVEVETDVLDGVERLELTVEGTATSEQLREEVFFEPRPLYDVLFVLDDGPQMLPFAASIATELGNYATLMARMDTRVGVLTTSTAAGEIGRSRSINGGDWLTRPSPAELSAFGAITGQQSSRSSCMEAVSAALADPASGVRRMLRPNARLHLVCVTNRVDEVSAPAGPVYSALQNFLPPATLVGLVLPMDSTAGCGGPVDDRALARWMEVTWLWAQAANLCTPRWGEFLSPLPNHWGYRTNYFLSEGPDLLRAPLRVTVNGVEQPEGEAWVWDAERGSVNFEPLYAPGWGDELRIRYLPQCAP